MGKRKQGTSKKNQYSAYKNESRQALNAERKLITYCKKNPNDQLAQARLDKGIFPYRRKKPHSKVWNTSKRNHAMRIASCGGNGHGVLKEVSRI